MKKFVVPALFVGAFLLNGCVAKAAWDVATFPVKAGAKAVDLTTTSSAEADRNYAKKMRKREAREGKERRARDKACRRDPQYCGPYDGYRANSTY